MTVQVGLCQTCSETTLLVFPRGCSNDNAVYWFLLLSVLTIFKRQYTCNKFHKEIKNSLHFRAKTLNHAYVKSLSFGKQSLRKLGNAMYRDFENCKKIKFHLKNGIVNNFAQNIDCGCTLEPKSMFCTHPGVGVCIRVAQLLNFLVKVFISLCLLNILIDPVDTLHAVRYWSEVPCRTSVSHQTNLEVKVTDCYAKVIL